MSNLINILNLYCLSDFLSLTFVITGRCKFVVNNFIFSNYSHIVKRVSITNEDLEKMKENQPTASYSLPEMPEFVRRSLSSLYYMKYSSQISKTKDILSAPEISHVDFAPDTIFRSSDIYSPSSFLEKNDTQTIPNIKPVHTPASEKPSIDANSFDCEK